MKIGIIEEKIIQPDITKAEIEAEWENIMKLMPDSEIMLKFTDRYPATPAEMDDFTDDCDALFGVWITESLFTEEFFLRHPRLKYVATLGHGYESFDYDLAKRYGVTVTNTVYGSQTIAEYAFALLMDTCHHINIHDEHIHQTDWSLLENRSDFCKALTPQIELYGKTIGVVGLGAIGFAFAKMANGFGMNVVSYSRTKKAGEEYSFVKQLDSLDELLSISDIISLHLPENGNAHVINEASIRKMKDGVIMINTARGILIDESAMAAALRSGKVRACAVDVLEGEPPINGSPLLSAPHCTITGHIAWLTRESRFRAIRMALDNYQSYINGHPVSVINK